MYKLFLTLRYLTRKKIVIFPILAIWLCVMMMIIVASIMGGFVDHAQQVNRDLNGDIIVSGASLAGWPYYEEFAADLQKKFPDIADWTPVIRGYGLINSTGTGSTRGVQIVGVDPVGRSKVCNFRQSLYRQYQAPHQAADDLAALGLPKTGLQLLQSAEKASDTASDAQNKINALASDSPHKPQVDLWALLGLLIVLPLAYLALGRKHRRTVWSIVSATAVLLAGSAIVATVCFWPLIFPAAPAARLDDAREQADLKAGRAYRTALLAADLNPTQSYADKSQILAVLLPKEPSFAVPPDAAARFGGAANTPQDGCYVGVDLMGYYRDQRGNFHHSPEPEYIKVILTVVPVNRGGSVNFSGAMQKAFVITDDFYTGVFEVDKQDIYASFDVIQETAGMRSDYPQDSPNYFPPRCNNVLLKLKPGRSIEQMDAIRNQISRFADQFIEQHPDVRHLDVLTWQDEQKTYLDAVRQEKVMMAFILLLMSGVVIVVIFLIFYMLVRDKTRDIGIIKAVGGSEEGVAQIFLSYGLVVGLVGGILGVISGVSFVHHTNEIHDFIFQLTGHMIWDRKVYVFDRIPDTVNPTEVAVYFALALVASFFGALIPALVAGSEDPVKAVRYE